MHWSYSLSTYIWIFSIGRGNAMFVRSGLNQGFIIDMGDGEGFDPARFAEKKLVPHLTRYKEHGVAQALLSHPHRDHIAQCARLDSDYAGGVMHPTLLTCPHHKDGENGANTNEKLNWNRIVNPDGAEEIVASYKALYSHRSLPLQTIEFDSKRTVPNLQYGVFYIRPPLCQLIHDKNDQDYGNSTSMMLYFRHGDNTILFPGDMTPEGMAHLLEEKKGSEKRYTKFDRDFSQGHPRWHLETSDQPSLRSLLRKRGLTILVAPHHGLESCFSADLYDALLGGKPRLVVISEKRHTGPQDGKVDKRYQSENGASGLNVEIDGRIENRKSLSTANGHHILIAFNGTGSPKVYADGDPQRLLSKIGG